MVDNFTTQRSERSLRSSVLVYSEKVKVTPPVPKGNTRAATDQRGQGLLCITLHPSRCAPCNEYLPSRAECWAGRLHAPKSVCTEKWPLGSWGAHRELCPCCAKSRLFFTTGSHGSQGPEFCTFHAVLNGSCTLLLVGGLQGCSRDKQCNNWRCARAVQKRPLWPLSFKFSEGNISGAVQVPGSAECGWGPNCLSHFGCYVPVDPSLLHWILDLALAS